MSAPERNPTRSPIRTSMTRTRASTHEVARAGVVVVMAVLICIDLIGLALYGAKGVEDPGLMDQGGSFPGEMLVTTLDSLGIASAWYVALRIVLELILLVTSVIAAAFVLGRSPTTPFHLYVAVILVTTATCTGGGIFALSRILTGSSLAAERVGLLSIALFFPLLYLFPNGSFVPRWSRWCAVAWVMFGVISVFFPWWTIGPFAASLALSLLLLLLITAGFAQVYRYLRVSTRVERQQTKWVILALVVRVLYLLVIFALPLLAPGSLSGGIGLLVYSLTLTFSYLLAAAFAVSIAVAILRFRLFDVDLWVSRTATYAVLAAIIVTFYVLVVGGIGLLWPGGDTVLAVLTTASVALAFNPLRMRLQRWANRLVFGERHEPYEVIAALGERLSAAHERDPLLDAVTKTLTEALHLPFAAIVLVDRGHGETRITAGIAPDDQIVETFPLVYDDQTRGRLDVVPRIGETLTTADRRLLGEMAAQVAVAVSAVQTTEDLRRSREQLVGAREEERRRLHRDLHDGLGPTVASLHQRVDAAVEVMPMNPELSARILDGTRTELLTMIGDIRRLVYDLRPAALDELGLVGAIDLAVRPPAVPESLDVRLVASDLPALPPAVEVAAYRIAVEAMTNVRRHATADTCTVELLVDSAALIISVSDDGGGIAPDVIPGVGVSSMRERAEEIGGTFSITGSPASGTVVRARLPISVERHE